MKKLPEDFEMDKYGLHVRLVNEDDAEFIVKLRTNDKLSRYISSTSDDVEAQRRWIRDYKEREKRGEEYYFIYYYDNKPCGVNRLYDIREDGIFNGGSWVFLECEYSMASIAACCIKLEIAYDTLGLKENVMPDGVHVDNKNVLKFDQIIGAKIYGTIELEKGTYYQLRRTKEDFYKGERRIIPFFKK